MQITGRKITDMIEKLERENMIIKDENYVCVVRCKDCKYMVFDSEPDDAIVCTLHDIGWRKFSDFCSDGIRRDENEVN